jgi:Fur family transcriptional regulator, ferric uptake regulator
VLEVVREADDYLGADEVYRRVYEKLEGIGIATVYRTLQLLNELGVLSRIVSDDGKALYRIADEEAVHHRIVLICRRCSTTRAVPAGVGATGEQLATLHRTIENDHEFTIEQSVHQLFGVCRDCSRDQEGICHEETEQDQQEWGQ